MQARRRQPWRPERAVFSALDLFGPEHVSCSSAQHNHPCGSVSAFSHRSIRRCPIASLILDWHQPALNLSGNGRGRSTGCDPGENRSNWFASGLYSDYSDVRTTSSLARWHVLLASDCCRRCRHLRGLEFQFHRAKAGWHQWGFEHRGPHGALDLDTGYQYRPACIRDRRISNLRHPWSAHRITFRYVGRPLSGQRLRQPGVRLPSH